ncbi:hypothetical protein C8J56DRAFT_827658 [Mycena floridula]|nr:hypothetical protein C8J56DRAFT_827658 [Mycena floridula]
MQSTPVCPHCHKDTSFQPQTVSKAKWLELKSLLRSPQTSTPTSTSAFVSGVEADLRKCQQETDRQKLYIAALETKRQLLQKHLETAKALAAPIRKFPPEVLTQIFSKVCDWNAFGDRCISIPGLVLAQVCSYWRNIVLPKKDVWSRIHWEAKEIPEDSESEKEVDSDDEDSPVMYSSQSMTRAVKFLLEHSGEHPLDLELELNKLSLEDVSEAWVVVLAHSHRWRSISIDLCGRPSFFLPFWIFGIKGKVPLLQEVEIFNSAEEDEEYSLDCFQDAPRLSTVSLDHDIFHLALLPWTALRVVSFNGRIFWDDYLAVLLRCTNAIEIRFDSEPWEQLGRPPLPLQNNVIETLKSLDMTRISSLETVMFALSLLSFPSFTALRLAGHPYKWKKSESWRTRSFPWFEAFLSQSQCTITTLSIENLPLKRSHWLALLRALPALKTLSLELEDEADSNQELICDKFLEQMNQMPPLLVNLENLTIRVPYASILSSPDLFLHMISVSLERE